MPIFIVLLFGTFAVSQAIYAQAQMRFAVQDSSRTFMVNPNFTPSQMEAAISVHLSRLSQTKILWINAVDTDNSDGTRTTELRVGYQYDLSIPMVAAWPLVFETKTEILREQPKSP
jgi:Flp pilus assembly protein TadG